jgi:hypothetical protein
MSFWSLRGSKIFKSLLASLALTPFFLGGQVSAQEENHLGVTTEIAVTLSGITSYRDFIEIRTALAKTEGVDRVTLNQEAPGLIALSVRYEGETKSLVDSLVAVFPAKYRFKEKNLKTGSELNITKF